MMSERDQSFPQHMRKQYGTARAFRVEKRRQIRVALRAVADLRHGCAYTPAEWEICKAIDLLEGVQDALSVNKWKR